MTTDNKTPLCTDEWEFYSSVGFKAKYLGTEECSHCNSRGYIGGGLADPDDSKHCFRCGGTGSIPKKPKTEMPTVDPILVERLKDAYQSYLAEMHKNVV